MLLTSEVHHVAGGILVPPTMELRVASGFGTAAGEAVLPKRVSARVETQGSWLLSEGSRGSFSGCSIRLRTDECSEPAIELLGGTWAFDWCTIQAYANSSNVTIVGGTAIVARGLSELRVVECTVGGRGHGRWCADALVAHESAELQMERTCLEFARIVGLRCLGEASVLVHEGVISDCGRGVSVGGEASVTVNPLPKRTDLLWRVQVLKNWRLK
jgi:hypothetical protein